MDASEHAHRFPRPRLELTQHSRSPGCGGTLRPAPPMDEIHDPATLPAPSGVERVIAGRYRYRRRLGRGASKEVYLVHDDRLDRDVALAVAVGGADGTTARARLEREARVTGRLGDHPNVITVYDTLEIDGLPCLVLRAMPGGSLADAIDRARIPLADAIRVGRDIAAALAHAHAHGIVHRDVKPGNVWLAGDGSAALGDFGIAYEPGGDRLTADGVLLGTVRYLAPEQIRGEPVGPAADVYALGVTLYELVAGRPPFMANDPAHVLTQHLTAVPVPPSRHASSISPALEGLILEALAKEPAQRPRSSAVVAALERISGERVRGARRADARRVVSVLAVRAEVGDPEALHGVLDRCASAIEQHGGTVEQYFGETLVGIFGLTESHDDDALRAARAAGELLATVGGLRLGIETGEIFLGPGPRDETIATGAAITAAGRLAERAGAGEILLGVSSRDAVAALATIDPATGRLLELHEEQPALLRAPGTPFVGRTQELEQLHAAFEQTREECACRLVTVAGPAGIGKSRLAGEFVTALGDATLLAGHCLAYGEGTTYQALAEIVRGLGGEPRQRVAELLAGDEQAVRGILAAVGLSDEPAQPEETAWAMRRLLERVARDRPVVVAVEDVHWAEPAMLDLLDHVVALSSGAPILLICLTRPELLEAHPAWAMPQHHRSVLVLEPLDDAEARELAVQLGAEVPAARIARRAEGNPLFVEQLVAVAAQDESELPASIQAVLTARIDRLAGFERTVLQRASVEGRTFHSGALAALSEADDRAELEVGLVALVRKGLITADRPGFAGEDAFRFTHALIREAAYAGLPKHVRADLHTSLAEWLERRPVADEIVAFHLEQASRLGSELGRGGQFQRELATRAADRFKAASRAALGRGDPAAACSLLERAVALRSEGEADAALLSALGASLFQAGRLTRAAQTLDEAIAHAHEPWLKARAKVEREFVRLEVETNPATERAHRLVDAVLPVLERERDDDGQCRAWSLRAQVAWIAGHVDAADDAWREAARCAQRAGDERALFGIIGERATAAVLGPTPVDEAIRCCEEFRDIVSASPVAVAWTLNPLASLHAMRGEFELAEGLLQLANETLDELGSLGASVSHHEALVRLLAGEPERAEATLRRGVDRLASMGDTLLLATTSAMLAQAAYAQGRLSEAAERCDVAERVGTADDIVTHVIWRSVKAKVLAREGELERAEALARDAVALVEPTDLLSHRGDAMLDLGEVLRMCSRKDESNAAIRAGISLYERKGNIAAAEGARSRFGNRPGEA